MKKEIGLWIDHKEAVIATASAEDGAIKRVESHAGSHTRFSGEAARATEEDTRDNRFANHLREFYDDVIKHIHDADSILIIGPGEAKFELKKRLESKHLDDRIAGVETADRLSDPQVAARVKEFFLKLLR